MSKLAKYTLVALVLGGFAGTGGWAVAADRTADEIVKELESTPMPKLDMAKRSDAAYVRDYRTQSQRASSKRNDLILELYTAAPDNEKLATLLPERWNRLPVDGPQAEKTRKEVEDAVAHTKNETIKAEGTFVAARLKLIKDRASGDPDLGPVDAFIKLAPKDPRGASLLYLAMNFATGNEKTKIAIEDRILKEYADSPMVARDQGSTPQAGSDRQTF